jgi:hypothetical protein
MKRLSSRRPWRLWLGGNGHRVLGGVGLGRNDSTRLFPGIVGLVDGAKRQTERGQDGGAPGPL